MYTVYTKEACGYCDMAKAELARLNIEYEEKLVTNDSNTLEEVLEKSGKNIMTLTFPQIFNSKGEHIGGYMDFLDYTEEDVVYIGV